MASIHLICLVLMSVALVQSSIALPFRHEEEAERPKRELDTMSGSSELIGNVDEELYPAWRRYRRSRTLPFQLVPQPSLGYAHSRNFVDLRESRTRPKVSASELLSLLDDLTNSYEGQRSRMRFGLF